MTEPIQRPERRWHHRFAVLTAASTLVLVFIGGLVTSTGSGLAVPDWPLSYGMVMPPMVGGIFYEHGHRLAAATVGFLTLVLAVWTARVEPRRGVRRLAWAALAAVVAQGVLGGLTVLHFLPPALSVSHACLAQTFFCILIALAYATSTEWQRAARSEDRSGLRAAALAATIAVYLQLVLGAVMRHVGAGLAIPDLPLAFGRLVPPFDAPGVAVHFAHRLGAVVVLASILHLVVRAWRGGPTDMWPLAAMAGVLAASQITLGALTVLSGKAILPTTAHVANGAALLGTCWLLTLRAFRRLEPMRGTAYAGEPMTPAATA